MLRAVVEDVEQRLPQRHAFMRLAEVLEAWSLLVRVQPATLASSLFAMAPDEDSPPRYKTLYEEDQLLLLVGLDPAEVAGLRTRLVTPA